MCKYTGCDKVVEQVSKKLKLYCVGTDCYTKQNKLDAKAKRQANKDNGTTKMAICQNDKCDKSYTFHPMRKHCCTACKLDQEKRNILNKAKQPRGKKIASKYLTRGVKHYNGIGVL